jgi:hypothetical protein
MVSATLLTYSSVYAMNNFNESYVEIKEFAMHGSSKRLCPDLVQDFKGFEETPEDATKEIVHLMKELNLCVSTEDVDKLITSYSEPMSHEEIIDIQEANKTPPDAKDDDCQSP